MRKRRISSRQHISQLESTVANLSKIIHVIELKVGHQHIESPEALDEQTSMSYDSDDESSESDVSRSSRRTLPSLAISSDL